MAKHFDIAIEKCFLVLVKHWTLDKILPDKKTLSKPKEREKREGEAFPKRCNLKLELFVQVKEKSHWTSPVIELVFLISLSLFSFLISISFFFSIPGSFDRMAIFYYIHRVVVSTLKVNPPLNTICEMPTTPWWNEWKHEQEREKKRVKEWQKERKKKK